MLAKTVSNDPTVLPARQALELATSRGAKAVHLDHLTGSLEPGKRADLITVNMDTIHNWPHFRSNEDAVYSRLVYATKSTDVRDVMVNGRWLMRDRELLTIDEEQVKAEAAEMAVRIDRFVNERESSPYNKLVILAGLQRQESYEIQVARLRTMLSSLPQSPEIEITKETITSTTAISSTGATRR